LVAVVILSQMVGHARKRAKINAKTTAATTTAVAI
jgi:hypothetical protein